MVRQKSGFAWGQFLKSLAVIAIPVALQNLLGTTAGVVDTMMLAPLGQNTVGAVGLCAQFGSLVFAGYWGFIGGGILFFAQYWGAQDEDGICSSYGIVNTLVLIVSVTGTVLAMTAPDFIMNIYTDKDSIRQIGVDYLRIAGFNYTFQALSLGMSALLRSTERVKIPLFASVTSVISNIFLNWVFIYGNLGAPAMGVKGAALATVCAGFINLFVIILLARINRYVYLFKIKKHFRWSGEFMGVFLRRCFPIMCNEVFLGIAGMVINVVLGRQSKEAIAAIAVFRVLEGIVIGFFTGFSSAASILVGKAVGAGQLDTAYQRAKRLVLTCAVSIFSICCVLLLVRGPILNAMGLTGKAFSIGSGLLIIYCVAAVLRMCNWVQNDTYRAAGDAAYGTVLEIVFMYAMLVPAVCVTGLWLKAPILVIFACCYIDEPIRFVMMQWHMYTGKWIKPVTEQGMSALPEFMQKRRFGAKRN